MKHIRPNLPRHMGDIDILLSLEKDFLRTCQIAKDLGYVYEEFVRDHSFDLHLPDSTDGTVDIHRYVNFGVNYDKKFTTELFSRSTKENVFGVEAFVPCFEDLLFLGIVNMARNLNNKTSIGGILFYLFDFKFLIRSKENFNWNIVLQNIAKTNTGGQAFFAMKFVNKIIPGMLPEILLNNKSINKQFFSYCNHIVFEHLYFADLKQKSKKLSLKNAFNNLDSFIEFLIKKPQYFIIKRLIRKSSFLITIFLEIKSKKQFGF